MRITIPEKWLSEAKYPVIVDPTIGTATVGSQYKWDADPPEPWVQLMFEGSMPVNRFLVSEAINGTCTAYMYSYVDNYDENGGRPVLYSDNGNSPLTRKSMNEGFADFTVNKNNPAGWRSATFKSNGSIASGAYIWFGVFADFFWEPRFDYGAKSYVCDWYDVGDSIPNTYPIYDVNWYSDFKLSMYFTYTATAQNYVRTITQGVTLTDKRKLIGNYKRSLAQTAGVNSLLGRVETFYRKVAENIKITMANSESRCLSRKCTESVKANSGANRKFSAIRKMQEGLRITDIHSYSVLFVRNVADNAIVSQNNRHWGAFIRGLQVFAGSVTETTHKAEYYRFQKDTVQVAGAALRSLLLFVRIVTKVFIRDYLLGRFLKAREELNLKSAICREIILDSKID